MLSNKDIAVSTCLQSLIETLQKNSKLGLVEENQDYFDMCIDQILMTYPIVFQHRYSQILKEFLQKKLALQRYRSLSLIEAVPSSIQLLSKKYAELFDAWINDTENISFATKNRALAGSLSLKDSFILHLFAMATCRRIKNDQCYSLAVTGASTSGKSTIFESPLLEFGHSYNGESGVGRFCLGSKNLLIAQDIDLKVLILGKDASKFRCIARGEPIKYKTFGSEATLKPTFLFVTSNENIQTHFLSKNSSSTRGWDFFEKKVYSSKLYKSRTKRPCHDEFVTAIKNRFLEVFVCKPPNISATLLPSDGEFFERIHLVLGLLPRVLDILSMPDLTFGDYGSKSLFRYCLSGVTNHLDLFKDNMKHENFSTVCETLSVAKAKVNV